MDNHADNFIISENYVAGLVDSDFGVYIHRFYPRGKLQLRPTINFVNTNFNLIELCHNYLESNNINHHIANRLATVGKDKKEITIKRQTKCIEFVDKISSYSVVRRPQLEIIRKFCESRLTVVNNLGWKQNNTPYTEYQKSLYDEIVNLNLNYNYDNGNRNYTFSWLCGLIDGDGSICFVVTGKDSIIPCIDVTTGSDTCRNNICELFDKYGIIYGSRVSKSKAKKKLGKNKKKFHYNIYVKRMDSLFELIKLLDGKLYIKQKQLNFLKDYLISKKYCGKSYTYHQLDIVGQSRLLNKNSNNKDISETNTQDT
jgi:hypothetical protein